jgi:steroid delta-isomerase
MLAEADLRRHADLWISAWNARNIDAVLASWAADGVFVSPLAEKMTGCAEIRGADALRDYWASALGRASGLRFVLIEAHADVVRQTLVVHYEALANGACRRAVEIMSFSDGRQVRGEALYGTEWPTQVANGEGTGRP